MLIHRDIVYLEHFESKGYLTDLQISYQNGYLIGVQPNKEKNTMWILEKYFPSQIGIKKPNFDQTEIWPGDLLVIRNASTGNVLTFNLQNKSLVTKQVEVLSSNQYDGSGEQQFVLQLDKFNDVIDKVRIVNVQDDNHALHSHNRHYKNLTDVFEVTGFKDRDNNDYWNIIQVPKEKRKSAYQLDPMKTIMPRTFQYVHNQDKVVIRNYLAGGCLHSHNSNYTHGIKSQEVTWRQSVKRDQNDWWTIKLEIDDITQPINNLAKIILQHPSTGKYLSHFKDQKNKKKDYLEISCGDSSQSEFIIQGIDKGIPELNSLITEYPFRIQHIDTQQYVGVLNRPSSKTTFQGEVALMGTSDQNTIWIIECVDSIFD